MTQDKVEVTVTIEPGAYETEEGRKAIRDTIGKLGTKASLLIVGMKQIYDYLDGREELTSDEIHDIMAMIEEFVEDASKIEGEFK